MGFQPPYTSVMLYQLTYEALTHYQQGFVTQLVKHRPLKPLQRVFPCLSLQLL